MTYNLQRYIQRRLTTELKDSLNAFPITALLGPRQCGKSTLAKHIIADYENSLYLDLERPSDLRKLEDAEFFFQTQKDKLICIDEVQMGQQLFPLLRHPIAGTSWEGWCIEQILAVMSGWHASFYRTASGEEIDLVLEQGRKRLAFEFKASVAPTISRGFSGTLELLQPNHVWIVAPVQEPYDKRPGVTVSSIRGVLDDLKHKRF